jgi:hypothetical protein
MLKKDLKVSCFLFLLFFCTCPFAWSQIRIASPYSRFGVGELRENMNSWNFSMGQTGIGLRNHYHVNFSNPASYTAFDSTSFIFEGSVLIDYVRLNSNLQSANRSYGSLGSILFGFPVTKWWKSVIGMVPYSDVGYNVASPEVVEGIGSVTRLYTGEGGINRFFWGNGFRIFRDLSIGVNASYMFGTMNRESIALFTDSLNYLNFKQDNNIVINDFYFDWGIQYYHQLKNGLVLTAGVVFSPATKISAKSDLVAQTFLLGSTGVESPRDTILVAHGSSGNILIPAMIGAGLSVGKKDNWMVGADIKYQEWKQFRAFDLSDSLVNSYQVNVGAEFLPDINNYSNYLKRIRYRIGLFYNSGYLKLRDKQLNEYAITFGFGFPVRGKTSINLGMQIGSHGTTEANLIKETFYKFTIGFSIYERWFVKRKYY